MPPKSHSTTSPGCDRRGRRARGGGWPRSRRRRRWRSSPGGGPRRGCGGRGRPTPRPRCARPAGCRRPGAAAATRSAAAGGPAQGLDLGGVLHRPERADHVAGLAEPVCRAAALQSSTQEPGPGAVADGRDARRADELGDERDRVLGLVPRRDARTASGRSTTRGASSRGTTSVASPSTGQHQHGEPLERHGLVADQPRQVGTDREQQHVDVLSAIAARTRSIRCSCMPLRLIRPVGSNLTPSSASTTRSTGATMTTILHEDDADPRRSRARRVAVVGYGNQGRSWALNLRDSGFDVSVCVRADATRGPGRGRRLRRPPTSRPRATPTSCACSCPTTSSRRSRSRPRTTRSSIVASGYTLGFRPASTPPCDVGMVAPRMLGPEVRRCYEEGVGFITAVRRPPRRHRARRARGRSRSPRRSAGCARARSR